MSDLENSLNTAFEAYNNHCFDMAEELAREVLTVSPTNGDALYLLGLIAYRAGALEPAEKLLYDAVKLYPKQENYALALASILQKEGRLDEALSFYSKYPQNAAAVAQEGYIYLQKGQNDFALSAFQKALSLDQTCLTAWIGEALVFRKEGRHTEALDQLEKAQEIGSSAELDYQLSVQNRFCQNVRKALQYINSALTKEQPAAFYNEKGLILEKLNDFSGAKEAYETAVRVNQYAPDSFANLGNLYLQQKEYRLAEDYYKKALALDETFLNAHHNLAVALCAQGRKAEGLEHYREALLIDKTHIPSLYNLAMVLEETGDYEEAAGLYFNILALKAQPPAVEFRIESTLAALYEQKKEAQKEAIRFAKGWVKHFPNSIVAWHTLNAFTHQTEDSKTAAAYAKALYEAFADTYEEKMKDLKAAALNETLDYLNALPEKSLGSVLDLGCGTGLFGAGLSKPFEKLIGVDFSKEMLQKAEQKNVYSALTEKEVLTFLKTDKGSYQYIVAIELSGYLPELESFISLVRERIAPRGLFIFSIENSALAKSELSPQGRYLYAPKAVEKLLKENNFQVEETKELALRKEGVGDKYASGTLFTVRAV